MTQPIKTNFNRLSTRELIVYLIVFFLGIAYVAYDYKSEVQQKANNVLQLAQSVESGLPLSELEHLEINPDNLAGKEFPLLRGVLRKIIKATPHARFAYIYVERGERLYFLADSEPETSPDYSPSGQEFTEAATVDKLPFSTKKAQVTKPVTDRWGTWVSAEVPVVDLQTGNVLAVFGMDYNANSWRMNILYQLFQSVIFVVIIFVLILLIRRGKEKNVHLEEEISRRGKTEDVLRENKEALANLVSNLPGFIYKCSLDRDYTMEFISDACLRLTGYSADDFLDNKKITFNELILPQYREYIWGQWQKVLHDGSVFEEEYPIKTASGEIRWLWERGRCIYDNQNNLRYLEGYIEDISIRKKAEKELKKLSQAIEQNPVSVVITDNDGLIEYVNPRFTEMTGYEIDEVLGKNPRILKSGKMPAEFYSELWETLKSGKLWRGEFINKNKKGEFYWANKSISPIIDETGQISHFIAVGEDITLKKQIEDELIQAKEKAEESDRLKSAFLANISHEIRTPMNGILGFAELLKEPTLVPEVQREYLEIIETSGQRMLSIINDLIDISKIEAGQMTLRIKSTNVNKLLHDLHLFFLPEVNSKNLDFDFHCDLPEEACVIDTDPTKLNQILTNLIKNAIKFTDKGLIKFGYKKAGGKLNFYVTDTGMGIPPDQNELIFERFRQSTINNLSRKFEGAGLGLAISKAYVEMLGGSIGIISEVGSGSTFYFDLPYEQISGSS